MALGLGLGKHARILQQVGTIACTIQARLEPTGVRVSGLSTAYLVIRAVGLGLRAFGHWQSQVQGYRCSTFLPVEKNLQMALGLRFRVWCLTGVRVRHFAVGFGFRVSDVPYLRLSTCDLGMQASSWFCSRRGESSIQDNRRVNCVVMMMRNPRRRSPTGCRQSKRLT